MTAPMQEIIEFDAPMSRLLSLQSLRRWPVDLLVRRWPAVSATAVSGSKKEVGEREPQEGESWGY